MKQLIVLIVLLGTVGCSSTPTQPGVLITDIERCWVDSNFEPKWVSAAREADHYVGVAGVKVSPQANDIAQMLARQALAEQIYTHVSSRTTRKVGTGFEQSVSHSTTSATNLYLHHSKTDFRVHHNCVVAWASVTPEQATQALSTKVDIDKQEDADWKSIRRSQDSRVFIDHLNRYPNGIYADEAKTKLKTINSRQFWGDLVGLATIVAVFASGT